MYLQVGKSGYNKIYLIPPVYIGSVKATADSESFYVLLGFLFIIESRNAKKEQEIAPF
jgi:hypothetical protein